MRNFFKSPPRRARSGVTLEFEPFNQYVDTADDIANASSLIPGWNRPLPSKALAPADFANLYADPRIAWAIEQHGGVAGAHLLEIGPMEATHTCLLERAGAAVEAVEANRLGFLKCLIAKEVLDLKAKFRLAEINAFLHQSDRAYDLIVACGVLYHMRDPLTLLELCANKAPALFLWTHFVSEAEREKAEREKLPYLVTDDRFGFPARMFVRSYLNAETQQQFCGGVFDDARWVFRDDLLKALAAVGYDDIRIAHEQLDHPNGPAFSVYARRSG